MRRGHIHVLEEELKVLTDGWRYDGTTKKKGVKSTRECHWEASRWTHHPSSPSPHFPTGHRVTQPDDPEQSAGLIPNTE